MHLSSVTSETAAIILASLFCLVQLCLPSLAFAQEEPGAGRAKLEGEIESVTIHPLMEEPFVCSDHAAGELMNLGDALGKDCLAVGMEEKSGRRLLGFARGDGLENEDYYGWRKPVLAPFDGVVRDVNANSKTNQPGRMPTDYSPEEDEAGSVTFERDHGAYVVYAHVRETQVEAGDTVSAGEVVAKVGNNGNSRGPHIHVGAWRGEEPLHIRFDQRALGRIRGTLEEKGDSSEGDS